MTCIYVYTYMYTYMHACMHAYIHTYMHVYITLYTMLYIYIYTAPRGDPVHPARADQAVQRRSKTRNGLRHS